jgi:hypothetical protein
MIQTGMLWLDDNPQRPLAAKIALAVQHYQQKHGGLPNICYVHPSCLSQAIPTVGSLKLVALQDILPHHFWLGVAEDKPISTCNLSTRASVKDPSPR